MSANGKNGNVIGKPIGLNRSLLYEVEPCLRNGNAAIASRQQNGSCHSVSRRKSDCTRRCILVLLLHAVFALAICLAFLIGHWISVEHKLGNATKTGSIIGVPVGAPTDVSAHSTALPTLLTTASSSGRQNHHSFSLAQPRIIERLIPLTPSPKEYTLLDVHPPLESFDLTEELHSNHLKTGHKDTLLVPLPLYILPYHYELQVDLTRFDTDLLVRGNMTIFLESYANSTEDEIQFHIGPNVQIERMRLRRDGKRVYPKNIKREDSKKLARILLRERLVKGKYVLDIEYNTTICNDHGVRCSLDVAHPNSSIKVNSFTTKFEATLARSFMPCFDEPKIKATFNISVWHSSKYVILSNMPEVVEKDDDGKRRKRLVKERTILTRFQETPPMSTYLVAFAVGEFVRMETRTERGIPVTVWTYPEDVMALRYTLDHAPIIFEKQEDDLEVPYPLPKMDLVAARNFQVGGMENWGLIVFEYSSIAHDTSGDSVNETVDRLYQEYKISRLIAHELSHQWFGNLVTIRDWPDLWLQEGFATFYVHQLLTEYHPILAEFDYFHDLKILFAVQSSEDSNLALVRDLKTEQAVDESFDITNLYIKGCVMVRMIRNLVSDFDFRAGVRRYLRKNAYRSVSREDLFASLPAYADHGADQELLSVVMEGWLINQGLPEVTVARNYDNYMVTVTQRKSFSHNNRAFLQDVMPSIPRRKMATRRQMARPNVTLESRREEMRKVRKAGEPSDLWHIPMSYLFGSVRSSEGQVVRQFWLVNRTVSFADVELPPRTALIANPDWEYPFRVDYDVNNWKLIARALHSNHQDISAKTRMQLLTDSEYFLSQSEHPHLYVYILGYLSNESELSVMLFGLDAIHRLVDFFRGSTINSALLNYLRPAINQIDKLLDESKKDVELAALWLVDPSRLSKVYQLRCVANLSSCNETYHADRWTLLNDMDDLHKQSTAVCHFLYSQPPNGNHKLTLMFEERLRKTGPQWITNIQLAACSRDQKVAENVAHKIIQTKNAAIYASSLQSDFSLHYNSIFRNALWNAMANLTIGERKFLFSTSDVDVQQASKILLHSVRSLDELRQVRQLVPDWGRKMSKHIEYLERQFQWINTISSGVLGNFFSQPHS
ncbi:hypothetical protein WR25_25116 [Diploscapter pachys]|uniref:Uncharacterized protein n=1 Tax=Diploscapter pachys TaxID=2018661 RepID=A0A2A2LBR6_9BILA|nr:hypothetical protein WR25_25116 [Diploscapter pachys]